jgi:hypothetical protein
MSLKSKSRYLTTPIRLSAQASSTTKGKHHFRYRRWDLADDCRHYQGDDLGQAGRLPISALWTTTGTCYISPLLWERRELMLLVSFADSRIILSPFPSSTSIIISFLFLRLILIVPLAPFPSTPPKPANVPPSPSHGNQFGYATRIDEAKI